MQIKIQVNSQQPAIGETARGTRAERVRRHYLGEARRIDAFNRTVARRELIGFWASILWLLFAGYFANPVKGWIWDHPMVLASGLLIAVVGYRIGASLIAVFAALFVTARGVQMLADRHFAEGLLAIAISLAVVGLVYFAADVAGQGWLLPKRAAKYVPPDQGMIDRFAEIEARISEKRPFGIFLRSFYQETSLRIEGGRESGSGNGMRPEPSVDYRAFDAIRKLIGSGDTYSLLNPIDPVSTNPFPTAVADPKNWKVELERLLARASWIVLFYEYESVGLDNEVRLVGEKYAAKSIVVFGPSVRSSDPVHALLSTACKWSFRLQSGEAEGVERSSTGMPSDAMFVEAPPMFRDWLAERKTNRDTGTFSSVPRRRR